MQQSDHSRAFFAVRLRCEIVIVLPKKSRFGFAFFLEIATTPAGPFLSWSITCERSGSFQRIVPPRRSAHRVYAVSLEILRPAAATAATAAPSAPVAVDVWLTEEEGASAPPASTCAAASGFWDGDVGFQAAAFVTTTVTTTTVVAVIRPAACNASSCPAAE